MNSTLWLIVLAGALSIVYGIITTMSLMKADAGSARMQEISAAVREGASAYLKRQYTTIAIVGVVILVIAWLSCLASGRPSALPSARSSRALQASSACTCRYAPTCALHRPPRSRSRVVLISPSSLALSPAFWSLALAFSGVTCTSAS